MEQQKRQRSCEEEEEGRDSGSLHPNAVISFPLGLSLCLDLPACMQTQRTLPPSLFLPARYADVNGP